MAIAKDSIFKTKQIFRFFLSSAPLVFYSLYRLRAPYKKLIVKRHTDIVIEGFPRSGNTFAVVAFEFSQGRVLQVAHHLHAPVQIIMAVKWHIPILVVIRNPTDAIASLAVREPAISLVCALREYVAFYEVIMKQRDFCVIANFDQITSDYGNVIARVNNKFQTHFRLFEHNQENVDKIFERIGATHVRADGALSNDRIARPSNIRKIKKGIVINRLQTEKYVSLLRKAKSLYSALK